MTWPGAHPGEADAGDVMTVFNSTAEQLNHLRRAGLGKQVNDLLDRVAIADLVKRYGQGIGAHDLRLLGTCCGDGIEVDHSPTSRMGRPRVSAEGWRQQAEEFGAHAAGDEHILLPQTIVIHGDTASCRVLLHPGHFFQRTTGLPHQTLVGTYELRFVLQEDGWKIVGSAQGLSWQEVDWQFPAAFRNTLDGRITA
ncbi:nuclear transport factor 2 family protein [Pseudoroseomonas globiformis]|uniref:Nuclear transport factor 2 family protein n=1 Tax=Teichococcus globiformis TaxID=2307229 RepID=A0ABV7FXY6_9PROT